MTNINQLRWLLMISISWLSHFVYLVTKHLFMVDAICWALNYKNIFTLCATYYIPILHIFLIFFLSRDLVRGPICFLQHPY